MILRLLGITESRLSCDFEKSKFRKFCVNEFEVVNHHEIETELTLRRFCMKFLDLQKIFKSAGNCYPLAALLLQTIGSKPVANAHTMENNGNKIASAFLFNI